MNTNEHLLTCLSEEVLEVAIELAKVVSKSNRFGLNDRNVLNPTGPTNLERLIDEMNDFAGTQKVLIEFEVIPGNWASVSKQLAKREKIIKFMRYAEQTGALK